MAGLTLLDQLALGDHICWTVGDDAVRLDSLAALVRIGLDEGHRILYCGDNGGDVLAAFERRGLPAGQAVASGALRLPSIRSSLLATDRFDPAAALGFLRREIDDAHQAGYSGLRLITDMSWASRPAPGAERLPAYEAEANTVFADGYVLGVCAYDPRVFDALRLRRLARAHPGAVGADEPFDPAYVLRIRRTREPFGLRLEGEADLSNGPALSAVIDYALDQLAGTEATFTIDVDGLRFVDTAAARVLVAASDRAAGRLRLVGHSPALARILELHGIGRPAGDS